jgi:hypothetical protein
MRVYWRRLGRDELDHELLWSVVAVAAAGLALAWWSVAGVPSLRCAFHALTGLPCPTCGATRALLALRAGAPAAALRANPAVAALAMLAPALTAYGLAAWWFDLQRFRIHLEPAARLRARHLAWGAIAMQWLFLVLDGR